MNTDGMLALHTLRHGDPGELPLVLLHGFPVDHRMWLDVAESLGGNGSVLALDLPGFGSSPGGPDVAEAVGTQVDVPSVDVMGDGVVAALGCAGVTRAVVAGLSMGGYVAMSILARHPSMVAGIGLLDTKAGADGEAAQATRLEVARRVLVDGRVDAVIGMRASLLGPTDRVGRPDLVEQIEGWIRDQTADAVAWAQRAMAGRPDRHELLAAYVGPALVMVGDEDELSPIPVAQAMVDVLTDVELVVVPGSGHMTGNEAPELVASALSRLLRRAGVTDTARWVSSPRDQGGEVLR